MKTTSQALSWFLLSSYATGCASCPFGNSGGLPPNDKAHSQLRRRLADVNNHPVPQRKLQEEDCFSGDTYDAIEVDIAAMSALQADNVARGHFLGGILRLAAHDFMDFDQHSETLPMGPDGCIDWQHEANAGLETIWCDDSELCLLKQVYDEKYSFISRADFWVAAANAVIKISSNGGLDLKSTFKWGRVDADQCPDSATRLPQAGDCSQVQETFLTRLGLTWRDAVALIGGHTIGRGNTNFSGHDGIWVDTVEESTIFDKRYYEEVIRRAWVPRNEGTVVQDWTWGNPDNDGNPRFMLNTDMCLLFDIETTFPCCSRTDLTRNNGSNQCDRGNTVLSDTPCGRTSNQEAAVAMVEFAGERETGGFNNDNGPFFSAFSVAWEAATSNGHGNLQELALSCTPTQSPTPLPTATPTLLPSAAPTNLQTQSPTAPPTANPTLPPVTPSPTASCVDVDSFTDNNGRTRDCAWTIQNGRCGPFAHLCPVSCGECECLLDKRVCASGDDCCSGSCVAGQCACLAKNADCTSGDQCCSGLCRDDGTCDGKNGALFD